MAPLLEREVRDRNMTATAIVNEVLRNRYELGDHGQAPKKPRRGKSRVERIPPDARVTTPTGARARAAPVPAKCVPACPPGRRIGATCAVCGTSVR